MISKELKKLNRRELVDIIYQMKKNEEQMQAEIAALQEALQEKRIRLSEAGSIAEAAVSVTNVFSAAQTTAELYLDEITTMREATKKECEKMIEEANKAVDRVFADARKQCEALSALYENEYKKCQQIKEEIALLEELKKKIL